jgi:hypothetical protein
MTWTRELARMVRVMATVLVLGVTATGCNPAASREDAFYREMTQVEPEMEARAWSAASRRLDRAVKLDPMSREAALLREKAQRCEHGSREPIWRGRRRGFVTSSNVHELLESTSELDPAWAVELRTALEKTVTVNFPDTYLVDAVAQLREQGVPVDVDPALLHDEITISLRLRDISARDMLRIAAEQTQLVLTVWNGRVIFSDRW